MRYIVQFFDKSTRRVSQHEAEQLMDALLKKEAVILRGAYFNPHHIVAVKPINTAWFDKDFVALETDSDAALPGGDAPRLSTADQQRDKADADILGVTTARLKHETPNNWSRAAKHSAR